MKKIGPTVDQLVASGLTRVQAIKKYYENQTANHPEIRLTIEDDNINPNDKPKTPTMFQLSGKAGFVKGQIERYNSISIPGDEERQTLHKHEILVDNINLESPKYTTLHLVPFKDIRSSTLDSGGNPLKSFSELSNQEGERNKENDSDEEDDDDYSDDLDGEHIYRISSTSSSDEDDINQSDIVITNKVRSSRVGKQNQGSTVSNTSYLLEETSVNVNQSDQGQPSAESQLHKGAIDIESNVPTQTNIDKFVSLASYAPEEKEEFLFLLEQGFNIDESSDIVFQRRLNSFNHESKKTGGVIPIRSSSLTYVLEVDVNLLIERGYSKEQATEICSEAYSGREEVLMRQQQLLQHQQQKSMQRKKANPIPKKVVKKVVKRVQESPDSSGREEGARGDEEAIPLPPNHRLTPVRTKSTLGLALRNEIPELFALPSSGDPDQDALDFALMISRQEVHFGMNMYDALEASDEESIAEYVASGCSMDQAVVEIFKKKMGVRTTFQMPTPAKPSQSTPVPTSASVSQSHSHPRSHHTGDEIDYAEAEKIEAEISLLMIRGYTREAAVKYLLEKDQKSSTASPAPRRLAFPSDESQHVTSAIKSPPTSNRRNQGAFSERIPARDRSGSESYLSGLFGDLNPDEKALQIGILISEQESIFGCNMYDSVTAADEEDMQILLDQGYDKDDVLKFIFDRKYKRPAANQRQSSQRPSAGSGRSSLPPKSPIVDEDDIAEVLKASKREFDQRPGIVKVAGVGKNRSAQQSASGQESVDLTNIRPQDLEMLVSMGFSTAQAAASLRAYNNNVQDAVDALIGGSF